MLPCYPVFFWLWLQDYNVIYLRLLAQTTLRNILGTKNLHEILSDRDSISGSMQVVLPSSIVDCPTQLTLVTWICQLCSMTNKSETYERTQQGNLLTVVFPLVGTSLLMFSFCLRLRVWRGCTTYPDPRFDGRATHAGPKCIECPGLF